VAEDKEPGRAPGRVVCFGRDHGQQGPRRGGSMASTRMAGSQPMAPEFSGPPEEFSKLSGISGRELRKSSMVIGEVYLGRGIVPRDAVRNRQRYWEL